MDKDLSWKTWSSLPSELSAFRLTLAETKRKRASEMLEEVFVKEDIRVDGMHRNLIPPQGVVRGTPEAKKMIKKLQFAIATRNDVDQARKIVRDNLDDGLAECKASASNLRGIQVKDIVKEFEDYLKIYSSAEMDIRWRFEIYNDGCVLDRLGFILTVEVTLKSGTPLTKITLGAKTTPAASKNHMIIPAPRGPNTDIIPTTEKAPVVQKEGGKVNLCYPAYQRAAPVMEDTRSQRAARVWFDELPPESIDGYKDLNAAFLPYFMQQKKYVKDPVEIHNIKQRDGETIEDFMEQFKVETGCMKGALECMLISGFMHRVNNPELTKRLNEHVPKTMEEMMVMTTAFIRGETAAAGKKKGHTL
ncbi:reverse transcriptase domain-containing protein [Tanacetum coccineum]